MELKYLQVGYEELKPGECTIEIHQGHHPSGRSKWHQTPALVEVPDLERWQLVGAP